MERLIIIEDRQCKKELDLLLEKYKKSVRLNMVTNKITRSLVQLSETCFEQQKQEQRLLINASNTTVLVQVKDIIRCQSNRNYTELHLQNGTKITVTKPLKQFAELPALSGFARIHLSHLVNVNHIDRFIKTDGGSLLLTNGTRLPVSKRRRDEWVKNLEII